MAVTLLTSLPETCYTSQLQRLELHTMSSELSFVLYSLSNDGNSTRTQIFTASYAVQSNVVVIYNIMLMCSLPVAYFVCFLPLNGNYLLPM